MAPAPINVGVVHASPVFMNKEKTVDKCVAYIKEAGQKGLDLLVFPETFLPCYPFFAMVYPPVTYTKVMPDYIEQSVRMDGPEVATISAACREARVAVVLGVSERAPDGTNTIFNSQFFFDKDGTFLGSHRKLQPTFMERSVWGQGSGHTLRTFAVQDGYCLGGLICWEHTMNLARHSLAQQGIQVHAAAWPSYSTLEGFPEGAPDAQIECLMKSHAMSAQTFVLAASCPVDETCLEWMKEKLGPQHLIGLGGGWSGIVSPWATHISGPVLGYGDRLLTARLDFESVLPLASWVDSAGHYGRPEVLKLTVDDSPTWCYDTASIHKDHPKAAYGAPRRTASQISPPVKQTPEPLLVAGGPAKRITNGDTDAHAHNKVPIKQLASIGATA
ncbi:carbon-nitrogen hydrolase [Acaromyces ingoldii]|uniref:Carbon-nitrogen hydrolase n=1 Tax=Acaromyces ingoldii TaxID=215250 RepID=A0A316YBV5_9BASI|nr:carbon-nitrogen hydrolase [Acaromyces ingoldii]PWN86739.1 carbon-nitrogen hydrolase [Acaromyces ingoldii]